MTIETDCQELVTLWNSRATNRCVVIPLLNQIQELSGQCTYFAFVHIRSEANMAAHYTSKFAFASNYKCMWLHDVLNFFISMYSAGL